ncbi:MAG TPA: DUF3108 domain-containing protein [Azospirillaceae bacterium]|nr:DUF3108 domain-containing protein [Azospirillaceae bacterium]
MPEIAASPPFSTVLFLLAALALPGAASAEPVPLEADYTVHVGGVEVLRPKARVEMAQGRYRLALSAETEGMLGRFAAWKADIEAVGALADGPLPRPERYRSDSVWREQPRLTVLDYAGGGAPRVTADPPPEKEREPVPDALKPGTVDPMSATVAVLDALGDGRGCGGTLPVYDGRQRYDLVLTPLGTETLATSELAAYAGPAEACRLEFRPVAGRWKEQGRRDRDGDRPRQRQAETKVWFARAHEGGPPLPVRVEMSGFLGAVVIHLSRVAPATAEAQAAPSRG